MDDPQAAQAIRLTHALRAQLDDMIAQLARVERTGATARRISVVSALRSEAAVLRRDINEAQVLIDRLQRRCQQTPRDQGSAAPVGYCRVNPVRIER